MSTSKTFAGLPVQGYGSTGREGQKQRPKEDLEPLFAEAIKAPGLVGIKWQQYTPYFNDGETCYFNVHDVFVRFEDMDEDGGEYDDGYCYTSDVEVLGGVETKGQYVDNPKFNPSLPETWTNRRRSYEQVPTGRVFPKREGADAIRELGRLLPNGEFDAALMELFGDHVEVTVTPTGIVVDDYEHE